MQTKNFIRYGAIAGFLILPLIAAEYHGVVKSGGFPLPGAAVTATQGDKKMFAASDQDGVYSFSDLPDGTWQLQVEKPGFSTAKQDVTPGGGLPGAEFELKMLALDEIEAVAAPAAPAPAAVPAPTTTSTAAPGSGTSGPTAASAAKPGSGAKAGAAAAPATAFQRTQLAGAAGAPATANDPAPEVTTELMARASDGNLINGSVQNGAASPFGLNPAFGNNRRSGSKLYTYSLALNDTNSALNAANYSLTGQNTPKTPFNNMTGTATVQGPLNPRRNNSPTVFLSYSETRNRNASVSSSLMPVAAELAGNFSQETSLGKPVQIYDPSTGNPFSGAIIPASRISPQALSLLQFYPAPNFAGSTTRNFQIPIVQNQHQDNFQTRISKNIRRGNKVHTFNGLFAMAPARSDRPNPFGFLDLNHSLGINSNLSYFRTYTPRFNGTITVAFSRSSSQSYPFFSGRENVSGAAGITGNDQQPLNWGPPSLNFGSGITGLSDGTASINHNQTGSLGYVATWIHNKHTLSFGGDFRRLENNLISQNNPRGTFSFNGTATSQVVNGAPVTGTGFDFADFLLGVPDSSQINFGNADKYFRSALADLKINDQWKAGSSVTVNLGVRWDFASPVTEKYNRLVNLDITPGFTAIAPVLASDPTGPLTGRNYPAAMLRPNYHEIEPGVGIAWRPFPARSLVVGGGYSLYYNTQVYQQFANQMAIQSPLATSLSITNSAADPLTLANGFYAPPNLITNTFAVNPNFKVGYAQNWNTYVKTNLPGSLYATLTYNGIKGTHELQAFAPNTYPEGAVDPCPSCPSGYKYYTSNANSTKEGGTLQLTRRLHNGLAATVTYTYSKAIDDAAYLGGGSLGTVAQNWLNLAGERGPSSFDQRHVVAITSQYTTGMGTRGGALLTGWRGQLIKGWALQDGINFGSGLPLTPLSTEIVPGGIGNVRADYTGAPLYAAPVGYLLNPAAIAAPLPGQWGNAGVDSITGPFQFSINAQMQRAFRIRERFNLQFNITASNPLNHVTISGVNTTVNSQFGVPSGVNSMRTVGTYLRLTF